MIGNLIDRWQERFADQLLEHPPSGLSSSAPRAVLDQRLGLVAA